MFKTRTKQRQHLARRRALKLRCAAVVLSDRADAVSQQCWLALQEATRQKALIPQIAKLARKWEASLHIQSRVAFALRMFGGTI